MDNRRDFIRKSGASSAGIVIGATSLVQRVMLISMGQTIGFMLQLFTSLLNSQLKNLVASKG